MGHWYYIVFEWIGLKQAKPRVAQFNNFRSPLLTGTNTAGHQCTRTHTRTHSDCCHKIQHLIYFIPKLNRTLHQPKVFQKQVCVCACTRVFVRVCFFQGVWPINTPLFKISCHLEQQHIRKRLSGTVLCCPLLTTH